MRHATATVTVRFSDCDPMGHTNNANYFTYMEQARVAFFKPQFPIVHGETTGPEAFPFILAEISCRFLKPTYMEDELSVTVAVSHIGNSSFAFDYTLTRKSSGEVVATGKSVQVWFDYKTGKSAPIPDDFKQWLATAN